MKNQAFKSLLIVATFSIVIANCSGRNSASSTAAVDSEQRSSNKNTLTSEVANPSHKIVSHVGIDCQNESGTITSDSSGRSRACGVIHDLRNPDGSAGASRPSDYVMCLNGTAVYILLDDNSLEALRAKTPGAGSSVEEVCAESVSYIKQGYEGNIFEASSIEFNVTK